MVEDCGGSQALGIYLDVGNATAGGLDAPAEIRQAGDRAAMVHVKDWDPANRKVRRLGAGAVDFDACFTALRDIGYDGYLIVEIPCDPADPEAVARDSLAFLKERVTAS
jgi:sugar phosphate isomerase/epimerase